MMKQTQEDQAVTDKLYEAAGDELRQVVERYEQLESEKKDAAQRQKDVMADAKGRGYNVKVLKKVIADRRKNADDLAEERAVSEMYELALSGRRA